MSAFGAQHVDFHGSAPQDRDGSQDALKLLEPHITPSAFYDAPEYEVPAPCHGETRERIVNELNERLDTLESSSFVWIHGSTKVGKTAAMRSLCDDFAANNRLLATFFFGGHPARDSGRRFVPSLVYQLCREVEGLRTPILKVLQQVPNVLDLDIEAQARRLLIEPILSVVQFQRQPKTSPQAIVVDGLDKCESRRDRDQILRVLNRLSEAYPSPLLIIVTSRPHSDARANFESSPLKEKTTQQSIHRGSQVDIDIRSHLVDKFQAIVRTHPLRNRLPLSADGRWPSLATIENLAEMAAGEPLLAAMFIRFVEPEDSNPNERLQVLLGHLKADEGDVNTAERLSALYRAVFTSIPDFMLQGTLDMLSICVVGPRFPHFYPSIKSISVISERGHDDDDTAPAKPSEPPMEILSLVLSNRSTYFHELAAGLTSLVEVIPHPNPLWAGFHALRPIHKSLASFLTSESRAGPEFFIHAARMWECLYMSCLECDFWHEDKAVMSIMLHFPNEARRSPTRFCKQEIPYTPEFVEYDYEKGAKQLPSSGGHRTNLWHRLACAASVVDSLHPWDGITWANMKSADQYARPFTNYLSTFTSPYRAHPELFVLMALAYNLGRFDPQPSGTRRRYALASDLRSALSSSPKLCQLDSEQGLGVSSSDGILGLHFREIPDWASDVAEAICRLVFGELPSPTWYHIIDLFAKQAVERRQVSPQVAKVVLSRLSFQYAAGVDSNEVGSLVDSKVQFNYLQRFLDKFPRHLDEEERSFVKEIIGRAAPPSQSRNRWFFF